MRRNLLQIGLWGAVFASAAMAQSTLTGRVLADADSERTPAAGAWVVASSGSPPRTVASAQADQQGAYRLTGLPEGRVEFTVSQRGYFTLEAGGATATTLARACPASGSCGEADFVIARASVVEGYVTDPFGDPLTDAAVQLTKTGEIPEPERRGPRGGFGRTVNSTDDRGYFRFYSVMPGEYELEVRPPRLLGEIYSTEPLDVSVELGESGSPAYIAMGVAAEPVRIGGVIDGLDLVGDETVRIIAANANGGPGLRRIISIEVDTENEAAPRLSGQLIAPGDYVLSAEIIDDDGAGRRLGPNRIVPLGRYRIDADMTDLRLMARQGATFVGRIRFEGVEPQRTNLNLVPLDGGTPANMRFNGRFQGPPGRPNGRRSAETPTLVRSALLPGRYRLEGNSNDYFVAGQTEFTLSEGQTLETEIVLSGAFAEVRGVVRAPAEDAAAGLFVVALRNAAGKVVSMQTDANGQYSFPKLLPGEYQICSWTDAAANPQNEEAWTAAGSAVKRFPVAAGDQTEILLTAKP